MSKNTPSDAPKAPRWSLWLPLVLFGAFVVLVLFGLVALTAPRAGFSRV